MCECLFQAPRALHLHPSTPIRFINTMVAIPGDSRHGLRKSRPLPPTETVSLRAVKYTCGVPSRIQSLSLSKQMHCCKAGGVRRSTGVAAMLQSPCRVWRLYATQPCPEQTPLICDALKQPRSPVVVHGRDSEGFGHELRPFTQKSRGGHELDFLCVLLILMLQLRGGTLLDLNRGPRRHRHSRK